VLAEPASIPGELRHPRFIATPLTETTAALDYASYRASPDVIRVHSDGRWPVEGFTPEAALEQAARHAADHVAGRAFTYVVVAPDRTEAWGCLYLNPLREYLRRVGADRSLLDSTPGSAAMVTFWIRQGREDTDLADVVVATVNAWLLTEWPLESYVFRVLPAERSSRMALERAGLQQVGPVLPGESRPYLWFQPAAPSAP
jgi:RimJ/RimL family protein N-acetyltransferase